MPAIGSVNMDYVTWADSHPEVAEVFDSVSYYKKTPWPCEIIDTGMAPIYQPCMTVGTDQELFVAGPGGQVFHSQDLGRTWSLLGQSPSLEPAIPRELKKRIMHSSGIGVTAKGTLLLIWDMDYSDGRSDRSYTNETRHRVTWITRSEDRGKTWKATQLLDPSPCDNIADTSTIIQLADGRLMVPLRVERCSRPGKPVGISEAVFRSLIYTSSDDGKTWSKSSKFTDHTAEPHLLELPSGKIAASIRYQRVKLPEDQPALGGCFYDVPGQRNESITGGPTAVGRNLFQHTAFTVSEDAGSTWSTPRLITGTLAQTGCLVRLSDGTLILTFGRHGQYFMISYDEGKTWSKVVYQLNCTGEYARSVALEDDTIITIHDNVVANKVGGRGPMIVLRWRVPPREEVKRHGFFTPREIETGVK